MISSRIAEGGRGGWIVKTDASDAPVRLCLISVEIFAWGKYGGFGRATRIIGREMANRGLEVFAVVPRRPGQKAVEELDGITVLGFPPQAPWRAKRLLREIDADLYHSCEPSSASYLALSAAPERKHIVTFRDPRDLRDWRMEYDRPSLHKLQVILNYLYENNILVRRSIRRMDGVFTIGRYLVPKVKAMYGLEREPRFLPTPVSVPPAIRKAETPTVCYMARMDRRKRPTLFLDLAARFPDVQFIAVGKSRDARWDRRLREKYGHLPNLEMTGFIDQFASDAHSKILERSWIMVNPATREALPNAFLEAAAHGCAILSSVDPDGFATGFGYHAKTDDFAAGLRHLLDGDRWRERGAAGRAYVKKTFDLDRAIDLHLEMYREVLGRPAVSST